MNKGRPIDDRLSFGSVGLQRKFILEVQTKLHKSIAETAELINVHPRSLRDWKREKFRMSQKAAIQLSNLSGIAIPKSASLIDWQKHLQSAGRNGRNAMKKKYGVEVPLKFVNEEVRKQRWRAWWDEIGKDQFHPIINQPKPVKLACKSIKLAEFIGIVLGDGAITDRQINITLHRYDDKEYSQYVRKLIQSLFEVRPGLCCDKYAKADTIMISRMKLNSYFVNRLGMKVGNKVAQQVDIPNWIKAKESFYTACVRGLVDTDGCFFSHRYKVNGKLYSYKKMSFTNRSQKLLSSVYTLLERFELKPRYTSQYNVWLDRPVNVQKYLKLIGTHNPKHLKRYLR